MWRENAENNALEKERCENLTVRNVYEIHEELL
jgi:hypothetical protein